MITRVATCACGQLKVHCEGEPVRISICHCLDCQKRTGSAFGVQARFPVERVRQEGTRATFARRGDEGGEITFTFCPRCGATVSWIHEAALDRVAVAVGAFADPSFPAPTVSVYEDRRHPWTNDPAHPLTRID